MRFLKGLRAVIVYLACQAGVLVVALGVGIVIGVVLQPVLGLSDGVSNTVAVVIGLGLAVIGWVYVHRRLRRRRGSSDWLGDLPDFPDLPDIDLP